MVIWYFYFKFLENHRKPYNLGIKPSIWWQSPLISSSNSPKTSLLHSFPTQHNAFPLNPLRSAHPLLSLPIPPSYIPSKSFFQAIQLLLFLPCRHLQECVAVASPFPGTICLIFQSAVIFYLLQQLVDKLMKAIAVALSVFLLAACVRAVDYGGISNVNEFSLKPVKKGLTFQATVWPRYESNWAGRFSCNNCNPFEGDQNCDKQLPLVCITSARSLQRPLYKVAVEYTPFAVIDGGYYDGWTGGVIQVSVPVRGYDLVTYETGNNLCQGYFGSEARWAKFNDGFYLPYMNQRPITAWGQWDWGKAKRGGWNFWGYFNHHYRGRAWVYVDGQPNGNCGR